MISIFAHWIDMEFLYQICSGCWARSIILIYIFYFRLGAISGSKRAAGCGGQAGSSGGQAGKRRARSGGWPGRWAAAGGGQGCWPAAGGRAAGGGWAGRAGGRNRMLPCNQITQYITYSRKHIIIYYILYIYPVTESLTDPIATYRRRLIASLTETMTSNVAPTILMEDISHIMIYDNMIYILYICIDNTIYIIYII